MYLTNTFFFKLCLSVTFTKFCSFIAFAFSIPIWFDIKFMKLKNTFISRNFSTNREIIIFYKFAGTEYSIDNDTKEKSKGQDQTESENPCQNFCHHGECHLTSFGNPYCKCESNYSGARCEIELCHNFCLNQGFCQISNTGSPNCTCVQGFMGFRCQFHESQSQLCHNFCLNDGLCQLDSGNSEQTLENPQQVCFCPEGFTGRVAPFCYFLHTLRSVLLTDIILLNVLVKIEIGSYLS